VDTSLQVVGTGGAGRAPQATGGRLPPYRSAKFCVVVWPGLTVTVADLDARFGAEAVQL
jgi:hypothetical protein